MFIKFSGEETIFFHGTDAYIDKLASVIPITDGSVRITLDKTTYGCD